MNIRKMKKSDRDSVAILYQQAFAETPWNETWATADALAQVTNSKLMWWVATDDNGDLVGFIAGTVQQGKRLQENWSLHGIPNTKQGAYLAELGVSPLHRRQGIARKLTDCFLEWSTSQKAQFFCVRTRPGTGNNPWYDNTLETWHVYPDGRILYGKRSGLPTL